MVTGRKVFLLTIDCLTLSNCIKDTPPFDETTMKSLIFGGGAKATIRIGSVIVIVCEHIGGGMLAWRYGVHKRLTIKYNNNEHNIINNY